MMSVNKKNSLVVVEVDGDAEHNLNPCQKLDAIECIHVHLIDWDDLEESIDKLAKARNSQLSLGIAYLLTMRKLFNIY